MTRRVTPNYKKIEITGPNVNVTYSLILNTKKFAKTKISHYSPIQQDCMNTHNTREKLKYLIIFDRVSSSTIVMGKLM